jgi:hypothetical protein
MESALKKRKDGVPTYTVPESAALLSISPEFLYRLVQADGFPAVRMSVPGGQGRYVVPAQVVDLLLGRAVEAGRCIESAEFTTEWRTAARDGVA